VFSAPQRCPKGVARAVNRAGKGRAAGWGRRMEFEGRRAGSGRALCARVLPAYLPLGGSEKGWLAQCPSKAARAAGFSRAAARAAASA